MDRTTRTFSGMLFGARHFVAARRILQLIQAVNNQDKPTLGGCDVKKVGKCLGKSIGRFRNFLVDLESALKLAHDPTYHEAPVGALRRGASEVDEIKITALVLATARKPVGQQSRLTNAGFSFNH